LPKQLLLGNWKLNGSLASNAALLTQLKGEIRSSTGKVCGICVPYVFLGQAQALLQGKDIFWGSQDVSQYQTGAYTGDVSAGMVAEFGSNFAIVGHSERRQWFGDTDQVVARKFAQVKKAGLTPIICVGETLEERESGRTREVVLRQLGAVIEMNGLDSLLDSVLAYEPVWAIGTGKTAAPQEAESVHQLLRSHVAAVDVAMGNQLPIVYGGSVKAANAADLFSMPNIDGGLVGGASLLADEFLGIWHALQNCHSH
jgi:triosephosphate isomerase